MMKNFKRFALATGAIFALTFANISVAVVDISGAGATFPATLFSKWAEAYKAETYAISRYQAISSDSGNYQFVKKRVDYASTDAPFSSEYLDKNNLFQFPSVIGGVVPVFHLEGISSGQLKLTGEVLADIFMGTIRKWNDPKIVALNVGLAIPNKSIIVFRRTAGSGTNFIFTSYLSKVSESWKKKIGAGTKVPWRIGKSAKNNETIANFVKRANGSIGYIGYSYAVRHKLPIIQLKNRDGNFVEAGSNSFQATVEQTQWSADNGFNTSMIDLPGKDSWPIVGANYIVIKKTQESPSIAYSILSFFDRGYTKGRETATELGFISLPDSLIKVVHEAWLTQIKDSKGNVVWE